VIFATLLFISFHPFVGLIDFLTLFLKILGLQGEVPNVSAGFWFQFLMIIFTKEILPDIRSLFPVLNFPNMVNPSNSISFATYSVLLSKPVPQSTL